MNDAVTEVMDNAVADVTNAVGDAVPTDVTEKIGFVERYLNELPQKALNLGIRVVLALVFFFVGVQVIKLIRRIVKKSLKRANADLGVIQFLDSLIKGDPVYDSFVYDRIGFWTGCNQCCGSGRFCRCGTWSCPAGKSFQLCRWCADPVIKTIPRW